MHALEYIKRPFVWLGKIARSARSPDDDENPFESYNNDSKVETKPKIEEGQQETEEIERNESEVKSSTIEENESISKTNPDESQYYLIGIDCGTFYTQVSYHKNDSSFIEDLFPTRTPSILYESPNSQNFGESVLNLIEGQLALSIKDLSKFSNISKRKMDSGMIRYLTKQIDSISQESNRKIIVAIPYQWNLELNNISTCFEHEAVIAYCVAINNGIDFKKVDERSLKQLKESKIEFSIFNFSGTCIYFCKVRKESGSLIFESSVEYNYDQDGVLILSEFCNGILKMVKLDSDFKYESGNLIRIDSNEKDERSALFTFHMNEAMMSLSRMGEFSLSETFRKIFGVDFQVDETQFPIETKDLFQRNIDENVPIFNSNQLFLIGGLWDSSSLSNLKKGRNRRYIKNGSLVSNGCILRELMIRNYGVSFSTK